MDLELLISDKILDSIEKILTVQGFRYVIDIPLAKIKTIFYLV